MKRKSIYKILWRVLLFCLAWRFASVAGAGTAITVYLVFLCRPCPVPGLPVSPLSAGRGSAFPAVAFLTDIITIKNRTSCSHLTKTG